MREEKEKLKKQVKSIVAARKILPNKTVTIQDISFKVNGGVGLDPSYLNSFIGKKFKREMIKDQPFFISDLKS